MGRVGDGGIGVSETFIGMSEGVTREELDAPSCNDALDVAQPSEAFASAARTIDSTSWARQDRLVSGSTFIEVELANQHPKTVRVGVTPMIVAEQKSSGAAMRPRHSTRQSAGPARDRSGK